MVRKLYAEAMVARGVYYFTVGGEASEAASALRKALEFQPDSKSARYWIAKLGG
jgi:Tfp pilus assembly protein PilF